MQVKRWLQMVIAITWEDLTVTNRGFPGNTMNEETIKRPQDKDKDLLTITPAA